MYIKKLVRGYKTYYILSVCDVKTKVWANIFITENIVNILVRHNVKLIEA